ncbi:Meiotically up-regulated gene 56 protein [Termitomyces sp. J132]|nr:Meiotically up-regulated gene 56 protein [Termitomyces sp. J132]
MPEKVISHTEKQQTEQGVSQPTSQGDERRDEISEIIKRNAFSFFIRQGGRPEDWGEDEEHNVVEEMFRRWRDSEWAHIWRRRREKEAVTQPSHWVGNSFEIGQFLGVNILKDNEATRDIISMTNLPRPSSSVGRATFVTASTGFHLDNASERGVSFDVERSLHASLKGKGKLVHYTESVLEEEPAPPQEVLERGPESLIDTSAEAAMGSSAVARTPSSEDRMLVRTYYSKSESVGVGHRFDERVHRTTGNLSDADWAEYLVAWRQDRIELYTDYSLPGKEWFTGHKHLAFVIPLIANKTHLTLYSFVDLTFCLTCPPAQPIREGSKKRFFLRRTKEGTNIFIFKHKSRSRAYDWTWLLWRQLGHTLPVTLDVRNPRVDSSVRIDIPPGEYERLYRIFNRENILALCMDSLSSVPDWKHLIERELHQGKTLQLVWRQDTDLDWVWLDDDVYGQERRWAVLCGLALKQSFRPPVLEIRLADHYPTHIHLKNGTRLHEPPAIEGYVERIRSNSQMRQSLYLSTHDGNLFVMTPNHAYPPSPPGLATNIGDIEAYAETLRKSEIHRGASQVMHAIGVLDLRDILVIRRASQERTVADNEDEGGEEGLSKAEDKIHMHTRRSFELLLTTGHVVRFETHSCRVAAEWIERLRALVLYWKQRHRMDAKEEMDLAQSRRPRLTPLTRVIRNQEYPPESPPDMGAPMPALGSLYSWCVLEGCKSIVKGGKLFVRKGLWGQYKSVEKTVSQYVESLKLLTRYVQLFLSAGHLVQFRIKPNSSLHHTMHRKTSLSDAYVCSGYLAAIALPKGQYKANVSPDPRRYQDGLETGDPEEEMLFMLWYHSQRPNLDHTSPDEPSKSSKALPALSGKRKLLVFRTRSRLERDAWCWALNCEIEKIVRAQKDREAQLRDAGNLVPA